MSKKKPPDFSPEPTFPESHFHYGKPRCQAWNPKRGRQCMGLAMVSKGIVRKTGKLFDKCKGCGGFSLKGMASPSFKSGIYSENLPTRLASHYERLEKDTDIMDMARRARLLETRVVDIISNLDDDGSYVLFRKLKDARDTYRENVALSRRATVEKQKVAYAGKATDAMAEIMTLIDRGSTDGGRWKEIQELTESIRRLADTEQRQIRTKQTAVMVDRVMVFSSAVGGIFRDILMAQKDIPIKLRRRVLSLTSEEVELLLKRGEYTKHYANEVINGEFTD